MVVIGSSPLTRGTLAFDDASYSAARFIPAYAGNSAQDASHSLLMPVHPRLRGELECKPFYGLDFGGSSPLTRGTLITWSDYLTYFRFIPAYAGNSEWRLRSRLLQPVHPRLRGELWHRHDQINLKAGSSPLTRGTHWTPCHRQKQERFIPAYAGNSTL